MLRKTVVPTHVLLLVAVMAAASISANAGSDDSLSKQQIQRLISSAYDKPDQKVETSPIAVSGDYAVADWVQGHRGGRALLHRIDGKWTIAACGANELKKTQTLADAGIPTKTAKELVDQLALAERSVSPDRLKLFGLFGTKDDPVLNEHHHNHAQ